MRYTRSSGTSSRSNSSSPTTTGPSTPPPRKQWEFHYRSFLHRSSNSHNNNSNNNIPSISHLQRKRDACQNKQASCPAFDPPPSLDSTDHPATTSDKSIRGGKLFKNVFNKKKTTASTSPSSSAVISALDVTNGKKTFSSTSSVEANNSHGSTVTTVPDDHSLDIDSDGDDLDRSLRRGRSRNGYVTNTNWETHMMTGSYRVSSSPSSGSYRPSYGRMKTSDGRMVTPPVRIGGSLPNFYPGLPSLPFDGNGRSISGVPPPSMAYYEKIRRVQDAMVEKKKKFTEFHNSMEYGKDSASAYLGDETSYHSQKRFYGIYKGVNGDRRENGSIHGVTAVEVEGGDDTPTYLAPVDENSSTCPPTSVLPPIATVDTWQTGQEYLMAPAIVAMCPPAIFSLFSGSSSSTVLGDASVMLPRRQRSEEKQADWTTKCFVLSWNYLLEYEKEEDMMKGVRPRGMAHLQYAKMIPSRERDDEFTLEVMEGMTGLRRMIIFRVPSDSRPNWLSAFLAASHLTPTSLYNITHPPINKGRYATIHRATRRDINNSATAPCSALKIISKKAFFERVQCGRERIDALVRETSVQATLSRTGSPTFVRLAGFFETRNDVILEMELMEGCDLFQHVSRRGTLGENGVESARIVRDLLRCVVIMRQWGVAHRDVKLANVFVCGEGEDVSAKLGDFGMAAFTGDDELVRGRCGTPGYVAPEILSAGPNGGYENKVDVFSVGVTMYILLCGYEPFYGENEGELVKSNKEAVVDFPEEDWGDVSHEAKDLIQKMLEKDAMRRILPEDALNHSWIVDRLGGADPWGQEESHNVLIPSVGELQCSMS